MNIILFQIAIGIVVIALAARIFDDSLAVTTGHKTDPFGFIHSLSLDAGFKYDQESIKRLVVLITGVSAIFGSLFSLIAVLVMPIIALLACFVLLIYKSRSLAKNRFDDNDEVCFQIARRLRSGSTLIDSILDTSEMFGRNRVIKSISLAAASGVGIDAAIAIASKKEMTREEQLLCAAISLSNKMGGNSARIFERIGEYFHQIQALREDTFASLSQVRISAYVIVALPVGMFAMSLLTNQKAAGFLINNPLGWVCLFLGVLLEIAGALWMKRLVRNGVGPWVS